MSKFNKVEIYEAESNTFTGEYCSSRGVAMSRSVQTAFRLASEAMRKGLKGWTPILQVVTINGVDTDANQIAKWRAMFPRPKRTRCKRKR